MLAEHGVGGVGGDPLGRVHGDRVPVVNVLVEVVAGEDGAGAVVEAPRGDAVVVGVDGQDVPALSVAHRIGCGCVDVGGVVDARWPGRCGG